MNTKELVAALAACENIAGHCRVIVETVVNGRITIGEIASLSIIETLRPDGRTDKGIRLNIGTFAGFGKQIPSDGT